MPTARALSSRIARVLPKAGTQAQLATAAVLWAIGASILLVRGLGYVHDRSWHSWVLAIGLALGVVKARVLLDGAARKVIARIASRGRGHLLGLFSGTTWALMGVMMGAGMLLRTLFVRPGAIGAGILGAVYIGVGTALILADRLLVGALLKRPAVADPA